MKRKGFCALILALIVLVGLTGCAEEEKGGDIREADSEVSSERSFDFPEREEEKDSLLTCDIFGKGSDRADGDYVPKTDSPYRMSLSLSDYSLTESEDGFYFIRENDGQGQRYLYYMSKDTMEPSPVCSKQDCLHNQREIKHSGHLSKLEECNAYMNHINRVHWMDGQLYGIDRINKRRSIGDLVKISPDGSKRERLRTLQMETDREGGYFSDVLEDIHRGYLYYFWSSGGDNILYRLDLAHPDGKQEEVYRSKNGYISILFYDRYLYMKHPRGGVNTYTRFDLESKKEIEFQAEGNISVYEGRLAMADKNSIYLAGLDGSDPQLIYDDAQLCYTGGGYIIAGRITEDESAHYPFVLLNGQGEVQGKIVLNAVGQPHFMGAADDDLFFWFQALGKDYYGHYALELSTGELTEYHRGEEVTRADRKSQRKEIGENDQKP